MPPRNKGKLPPGTFRKRTGKAPVKANVSLKDFLANIDRLDAPRANIAQSMSPPR